MKFRVILFLAVLAALSSAVPARTAAETDLFGRTIRKIEVVEADSGLPLEPSRYGRIIGLKEGSAKLTRAGLKNAIQALYDAGIVSDISVSGTPDDDSVTLVFQVRLSSYFNLFHVSKGVDLGGLSAAEAIGLPVGERFSAAKLEDARQSVLGFMREQGFYEAQVQAHWARDGNSPRVNTTFEVQAGPRATVRSLEIQGVPENMIPSIRERLGLTKGHGYRHDHFQKRLDALKRSLVARGFLDVGLSLKGDPDFYRTSDRTIALDVSITNFGQVRVVLDGFKIPKDEQRRLLPVLTGGGLRPELVQEGAENLRQYLEERGYPEASITVAGQGNPDEAGVRSVRYSIERGRRVLVSDVEFRGNRAFTAEELQKVMQMQPPRLYGQLAADIFRIDSALQASTYSVSKLDADVESLRSLYSSAGYLHASVVPLPDFYQNGERVRLALLCDEGDRALVKSVTINNRDPVEALQSVGLDQTAAVALASKMRLKKDAPYSPVLTTHDRQIILAAFNDAGFLQPAVIARNEPDADDGFSVNFEVQPGTQSRIDSVVVVGRDRTRESVIDRRITLKPDQPLSLGKMLETQQALYSTGVFDLVRVEPQNPESSSPYQNVVVHLQEARPRTLRYGLGYQEREKVRALLEISDLNIFGFAQSVDLRLRGSKIEQAGLLSFKQPQIRFLPIDSYLTFSGSNKQEISFTEMRFDLSYQYSRALSSHTWSMLRYSFTNVHVSEVTPDLQREETPRNLSTISAFFVNDTRDNYTDRNARYLDPQKGFFTSTNVGFTVNHGGGGYYVSMYTQNSYYRRLLPRLLMATSLRVGFLYPIGGDQTIPVGERIPISERFFAGGSSSLRGFSTDTAGPLGASNEPIGGNAILIGNQELAVPVTRWLDIAGFYDIGNVFSSWGAIRWSDVSHTVGFGLRLKTPFGPIRLNYGYNLNLSAQLRSLGYKRGHFFTALGPPF
jgi:outer membrane protein insertion porin family